MQDFSDIFILLWLKVYRHVWRVFICSWNLVNPISTLLLQSSASKMLNTTVLSMIFGWETFAIWYDNLKLPPPWSLPMVIIFNEAMLNKHFVSKLKLVFGTNSVKKYYIILSSLFFGFLHVLHSYLAIL